MPKGHTTSRGMHGDSDRKTRGRTNIGAQANKPRATKPNEPVEMRVEANRPVSAGGGKHRGDRRDMNRLYTNNAKHASRGNNPRADVSTRKR